MARGITIILMIIGHVVDQGVIRNIIFSYHMPFFLIVSGFFYKKDEKFLDLIKKVCLKFFIPTVICLLLVNIYQSRDFLVSIHETIKQIAASYTFINKIDMSWTRAIGVLWFFPLLAIVKILFFINKKVCKENEVATLLLIVLQTYVGYMIGLKGYWLPFSFDVALTSMVFFYVGYILKKYNLLEKLLNDNISLLLCIAIWIIGIKYNNIELAIRLYTNGPFSMITAICGTIVVLKISKIISERLKIISDVLKWYGKESMNILIFHFFEINLINYNELIKIENTTLLKFAISSTKVFIATICTLLMSYIKKFLKRRKNYV